MGIAYLTEGQTGPSYVFFVFAIIAVGVRATLRAIIYVTLLGVGLYLMVISANNRLTGAYVMRAVYLAIAGYLVGFFAQQRANYEDRVRELEAQGERHLIARLLHDSYVQSLAGVNLRLESCRELLRRGRPDDASHELEDLQVGVKRQFDEVREYVRSLAGVDSNSSLASSALNSKSTVGSSGGSLASMTAGDTWFSLAINSSVVACRRDSGSPRQTSASLPNARSSFSACPA